MVLGRVGTSELCWSRRLAAGDVGRLMRPTFVMMEACHIMMLPLVLKN